MAADEIEQTNELVGVMQPAGLRLAIRRHKSDAH